MSEKLKSSNNLAKDVEKPKLKYIDIPDAAKAQISIMTQNLDSYIAGVVACQGITGRWSFDVRNMKIVVVEDK